MSHRSQLSKLDTAKLLCEKIVEKFEDKKHKNY